MCVAMPPEIAPKTVENASGMVDARGMVDVLLLLIVPLVGSIFLLLAVACRVS